MAQNSTQVRRLLVRRDNLPWGKASSRESKVFTPKGLCIKAQGREAAERTLGMGPDKICSARCCTPDSSGVQQPQAELVGLRLVTPGSSPSLATLGFDTQRLRRRNDSFCRSRLERNGQFFTKTWQKGLENRGLAKSEGVRFRVVTGHAREIALFLQPRPLSK